MQMSGLQRLAYKFARVDTTNFSRCRAADEMDDVQIVCCSGL